MLRWKRTIGTALILTGLLALTRPATAGTGAHGRVTPAGFGFHGWGPRGYGWYGPRGWGYYGVGFCGIGFCGAALCTGCYPYCYPGYYPYGYYPAYLAVPPGVPAGPAPTDNRCHIHVLLPADATLWVGNEVASKQGPVRDFVSPVVAPGQTYAYTLRARWTQGGQVVEQARQVTLHANETAVVNFGGTPGH
jgi:uncharacterized protein (TIGR03000 family)